MQLYFLPGASGHTKFWQPVIDRLKNHTHTHVIAYPEFGGFPRCPEVQCFQDLQDYVLDNIQQDSVIIAQSMGGIFAVQAALQKPDKVKALVLVATSGGIDLTAFDIKDWRDAYREEYEVPTWFIDDHTRLDDRLVEIGCPVLLIWGDDDPISPIAVGQYLAEKMTHSALYIVQNGQHDLAFQFADQVADQIDLFLKSLH